MVVCDGEAAWTRYRFHAVLAEKAEQQHKASRFEQYCFVGRLSEHTEIEQVDGALISTCSFNRGSYGLLFLLQSTCESAESRFKRLYSLSAMGYAQINGFESHGTLRRRRRKF